LKRELGKILQLLISGHIKELFVALGANFQSMATSLELVAKRPDEFSVAIENENGRVILQVLAPFMIT